MALAPEKFAAWLDQNAHGSVAGRTYHYHPRSNSHSRSLAQMIWDDLYDRCEAIHNDYDTGKIIYEIDLRHRWPATKKEKTIDLAVGTAARSAAPIGTVLLSCELKCVMTEHSKSKPRIFDELSSSHEIVHRGNPDAIAAGVTTVNIANTFMSPLRQVAGKPLDITKHRQPDAAEAMIRHLRGLPIRNSTTQSGFDAYSTFVVDCDNLAQVSLYSMPPAPQFGDPDHYEEFLDRICKAYTARF